MPPVSNPDTEKPDIENDALAPCDELETPPQELVASEPSPVVSKWYRWRHDGVALVRYLLDSEVHTFAFSVAANAILSFIPFIVLLYTLALSGLPFDRHGRGHQRYGQLLFPFHGSSGFSHLQL